MLRELSMCDSATRGDAHPIRELGLREAAVGPELRDPAPESLDHRRQSAKAAIANDAQ